MSTQTGIRVIQSLGLVPKPNATVFFVCTSIDWPLELLEKAQEIAGFACADIRVVALQVVPFPLPLDEPPVPSKFIVSRFQEKACEFANRIKVSVYFCRDPLEALKRILKPNYPVIIGVKKRFWPTRDERLARKLRSAGFNVISIKTE
jgi:hypothetical protein